jgi:hypothetical protein
MCLAPGTSVMLERAVLERPAAEISLIAHRVEAKMQFVSSR